MKIQTRPDTRHQRRGRFGRSKNRSQLRNVTYRSTRQGVEKRVRRRHLHYRELLFTAPYTLHTTLISV